MHTCPFSQDAADLIAPRQRPSRPTLTHKSNVNYFFLCGLYNNSLNTTNIGIRCTTDALTMRNVFTEFSLIPVMHVRQTHGETIVERYYLDFDRRCHLEDKKCPVLSRTVP